MEKHRMIPQVEPEFVCQGLSQVEDWGMTKIGVRRWREENGVDGKGVVVAILDTGVAYHSDLPECASISMTDSDVIDRNGHGTHVAGIIGAIDNGIGVIGVAPGCQMISIKCLDDSGLGDWKTIASGIRMAKVFGADVISMSLGSRSLMPDVMMDAIRDVALINGSIIVAAAGNDGQDCPQYPAACEGVISVGSVDKLGHRSSFSAMGDVMVPGEQIYSTWLDDGYARLDGTSMACPMVAGIVALLIQKHGFIGRHELKKRFLEMLDCDKVLHLPVY